MASGVKHGPARLVMDEWHTLTQLVTLRVARTQLALPACIDLNGSALGPQLPLIIGQSSTRACGTNLLWLWVTSEMVVVRPLFVSLLNSMTSLGLGVGTAVDTLFLLVGVAGVVDRGRLMVVIALLFILETGNLLVNSRWVILQ